MSFDFNVLSSDDEGEINILNESNNDATKHKSPMDGNESDENNKDHYPNISNGGFDFDGYDDYCDFDEDDRKPSSMNAASSGAMACPSDFDAPLEDTKEDDEEEDDDEIDWEDAHEERGESTKQPTTYTLTEITFDLSKDATKNTPSSSKNGKKRARSVAVFKHDKLQGNPGLQRLLSDLHKASLLAWAAHAHFCSAQISDPTNLGLAHSLLPTAWLRKDGTTKAASMPSTAAIPTQEDVGHFLHWFLDYARSSSSGDRGTRFTTNRTPIRSNPNGSTKRQTKHHLCNDSESLLLFLSMVRSMGWRARYVVADVTTGWWQHLVVSRPPRRDLRLGLSV